MSTKKLLAFKQQISEKENVNGKVHSLFSYKHKNERDIKRDDVFMYAKKNHSTAER